MLERVFNTYSPSQDNNQQDHEGSWHDVRKVGEYSSDAPVSCVFRSIMKTARRHLDRQFGGKSCMELTGPSTPPSLDQRKQEEVDFHNEQRFQRVDQKKYYSINRRIE